MNTSYTLPEVEAIIIEIQNLLEDPKTTIYNHLVLEMRYYTKLAKSLKAGA
jgi:hypothetical protein